ncbi:hypothetical protein GE09DRAFT_578397 [Coniochaeta sp. 2T2.1]|nr:hypothetical protein GE09DRAFT_578397 [Coniochaeta sp. 2T2.1]
MGLPLYQPAGSILYLSELEPESGESGILSRRLGPTPSPKHRRQYHPGSRTSSPAVQPDYHSSVLNPAVVPAPTRYDHSIYGPRDHDLRTPRRLDDIDLQTREGRDLARSSPSLPRRPSLEREEAFCGERPAKKRCRSAEGDSDETVRELYRLGLLYDNPHERGERFSFDSIVHDGPLYSINVRQSKRRAKRRGVAPRGTQHYNLPLELSMTALEDDERLARFLMAPDDDAMFSQAELTRWTTARAASRLAEERGMARPGLRVVYEFETENDEERSTKAPSTTQSLPASQDFPELVSDSEHDDAEGVEWEVLGDSEISGDGAAAGNEAWVVLG